MSDTTSKWPTTVKDWIETAQGVFACFGIVAAIWLWHAQGDGRPHVNITQKAETIILDEHQKMVALDVTFKNVGKITVSLNQGGYVNVLGILPVIPGESKLPEKLAKKEALDVAETGRIDWEALINPIHLPQMVLEPDEEQLIHLEFCIPSTVRHLRTDVNVINEAGDGKMGWQHRKVIHAVQKEKL